MTNSAAVGLHIQLTVSFPARAWRSTLVIASREICQSSRSWRRGKRWVASASKVTSSEDRLRTRSQNIVSVATRSWLSDTSVRRSYSASRTSPTTALTCWRSSTQRCRHVAAALGLHRESVDLEPDHGEGVADPVVQLASDAAALLVGPDRPEAAEQPSVVDGDAERLDEAVEQLRVLDGEEVGLA